MDQANKAPIEDENVIWKKLHGFRAAFDTICRSRNVPCNADALSQLGNTDLQELFQNLLTALQNVPSAHVVPSRMGPDYIKKNLPRLVSDIAADSFNYDSIQKLIREALHDQPRDILIWEFVSNTIMSNAIIESTPSPRAVPSLAQQTPWSQNTSSVVNSSEFRQNIDPVLRQELEYLYVGIPNFHEAFFGNIPELNVVSEFVFRKCTEGDNPLFKDKKGWCGWPAYAKESDVLTWMNDLIFKLQVFTGDRLSTLAARRKLLAQPRTPLEGSIGKRSMDIGFIDNADSGCHWAHILVAGELKSNPTADRASNAWIDLARYAREVLAANDTRRFVLGFTLCGSLMRVWEFDRLGGIASEQFDINKDGGLQFVATILGFLYMDKEMLGFDPTIIISGGQKYIEIKRNGRIERLIIDKVMRRAPCIAGRATTCWKAHCNDDLYTPLIIKDSWQYTNRDKEGEMIQEATQKGIINVARYYYHETVRVRNTDDEIQHNIRRGLDVTQATNYRPSYTVQSSSCGMKRGPSETDVALPPSKRSKPSRSASPTKPSIQLPNRVHRRVILRDYGRPIYRASSCAALLTALEGCIKGHESLYNAGFLHRDISIGNLMINEDENNPSWAAFLIDLDLAVRKQREGASGAKGRTGTRAFMAIGALFGHQHSFMHDLESFFWVLFWICIHYSGPNECARVVPRFDRWNYADVEELAELKSGLACNEGHFLNRIRQSFTPYFQPVAPWVNKLRRLVFPENQPWQGEEDHGLYGRMQRLLQDAARDPKLAQDEVVAR